ncbi:hypothetical protein BCPG1_192 [Bacillus phage BCPG1]|nr:hypothetical protein BCPG1_192 [Bacillus phage BCPG1]
MSYLQNSSTGGQAQQLIGQAVPLPTRSRELLGIFPAVPVSY